MGSLLWACSASPIGGESSSELFGQLGLFGQTSGTGIRTPVSSPRLGPESGPSIQPDGCTDPLPNQPLPASPLQQPAYF